MDKKERIMQVLEEMSTDEIIEVYNEYADDNRYERILDNDIDEILSGSTPMEVYNALDSNFNPADDYIMFNGYGMLESFSEYEILDYIYIGEIADYIINSGNDFNNYEIAEALGDDEEEDDDDESTI